MRNRYVIGPVIGAAIGMALGYFGTGSGGAVSLAVGAGIGALVGLFIVARVSVRGNEACGEQTGTGSINWGLVEELEQKEDNKETGDKGQK